MRTQVAIVGAGPAGLVLALLLRRHGIESVVLENRSRDYILARLRAGVLEEGTVEVLTEAGAGERLAAEGLEHGGIYLQWPGQKHHIDFEQLCGRSVWVYGQTEVVKDLLDLGDAEGQSVEFEVRDTAVHDFHSDTPSVTYTSSNGTPQTLDCAVVASCDGYYGVGRPALRAAAGGAAHVWERGYPYSWLGVLAEVPPSTDELIYAWHPDGFAMHSMRSPAISRLYLQVDATDDIANWSDDRIWSGLTQRLASDGWELETGPILEKSILPMRSFVSAPMSHGRLFLTGDSAHIVPPTGAKGLNLAVSDVALLADALVALLRRGDRSLADTYSDRALQRVWRATHFSWWMTSMLHPATGKDADPFADQLQLSQLRYVTSSVAAATSLAENYTGMPR